MLTPVEEERSCPRAAGDFFRNRPRSFPLLESEPVEQPNLRSRSPFVRLPRVPGEILCVIMTFGKRIQDDACDSIDNPARVRWTVDVNTVLREVEAWSVADRFELAQQLWDRLEEEGYGPDLGDDQKAELDRRLAAYAENPDAGSSWEEVKARIWGQGS